MTPEHKAALDAGRRNAHQRKVADALERVRAYKLWLATGSVPCEIPVIPSDNDYRLARARHG